MSKILAIDYGTKNIGLALSDDEQKIGFAYQTLKTEFKNKKLKIKKIIFDIKKICQLENVERIIIGLPINLSGKETESTKMVFNFVKKIEQELAVPVETVDERLSTVQAERLENKNIYPVKSPRKSRGAKQFHRVNNVDELSAQILLQSYLDS
jgi:putative Holliday junction resolvase